MPTQWSTAWKVRLAGRLDDRVGRGEAGQIGAVVPGALDERVPGPAVRGDRGPHDGAELVLGLVRLRDAAGAVLDGVRVRGAGVRDLDGEIDDAVAVLGHMVGEEVAPVGGGLDDGGEHEAGGAVREHVGSRLAAAVLRARVRHELHAEGGRVVVGGLFGVAHGEDDRVHPLHREGVGLARGVGGGLDVRRSSCHGPRLSPNHKMRNSL